MTVKPELAEIMDEIHVQFPQAANDNIGFGSTIFAVKPGDGSAREQAASCQKGTGRLGKYRKRICDQTVSFQSDQLGHAPHS